MKAALLSVLRHTLAALAFLVSPLIEEVHSQESGTGAIEGRVLDAVNHDPLPGARVTANDQESRVYEAVPFE